MNEKLVELIEYVNGLMLFNIPLDMVFNLDLGFTELSGADVTYEYVTEQLLPNCTEDELDEALQYFWEDSGCLADFD